MTNAASQAPPSRRRHTARDTTDEHHRGEQSSCVLGGVGRRQDDPRRDQQSRPRPEWAIRGPDSQPCRQGQQEQRHRVKGRERAQELGAGQGSEQPGRQQCRPPPVQPARRGPEQAGDPEHEAERQHPRGRQAAEAVRHRPQRGIDDRRSGEVGGKVRDRCVVQPPGPFQVPGPQVQALILECRVGPGQPERQDGLDGQDRDQRPSRRDQAADAGSPDPAGYRVRASRHTRDAGFGCVFWWRSINYGHRGHTPTPARCISCITYRDRAHPIARSITTETYSPYPEPTRRLPIFPAIRKGRRARRTSETVRMA